MNQTKGKSDLMEEIKSGLTEDEKELLRAFAGLSAKEKEFLIAVATMAELFDKLDELSQRRIKPLILKTFCRNRK